MHAYDLQLQRHVAVKMLHASSCEQPEHLAAFVREATITAQLDHPNIVPVHDLLLEKDGAYAGFSMKLVQGESLEQRLRSLGDTRLDEHNLDSLLDVLIKVCDALAFAHSRGVLHLDLKPANVMVGSHGQVYVMDWGIAARCSKVEDGSLHLLEPVRGLRGTPSHMAPEQLDGRALDQRTDVHALGGLLYEILTGHPPFAPSARCPKQPRSAADPVREPSSPGLASPPPGLMRIALRALAARPEDRHVSVQAFQDELESARRGGGWFALRKFAPGQVIMREGEPGDEAYLITEGVCEVFKQVAGSSRLLRTLGAGELFGEIAMLTHGLRSATVIAAAPTTAWVIRRDTLERELGRQTWVGALVKALAARFLEADGERARLLAELETTRPRSP